MSVALTQQRSAELERVNREVNALPYRTDPDRYGRPEFWAAIDAEGGDCEDYAIAKRRRLAALGWPREALALATCHTETGAAHAVLLVDTDRGTYALDNRYLHAEPWAALPYRWDRREASGSPTGWVGIAAR